MRAASSVPKVVAESDGRARRRRGREEPALPRARAVGLREPVHAALELMDAVAELGDRLLELDLGLDHEVAARGGAAARQRADRVAGVDERVDRVLDDAVRVAIGEAEDHGQLAGADRVLTAAVVLQRVPEPFGREAGTYRNHCDAV